jgi:integrase
MRTTNRDFILMCLLTGGRKSRVAEMRWDQISLSGATWRIPAELEKNGEEHVVPLVPKAVEILEERSRGTKSDWVFVGTGKTGHIVCPTKAWDRVKKRAGMEDLHLHDLRRTLGSWQLATGADLAIIGKTLNHKDLSTTLIYARLNLDPVRQSMEAATNALWGAAKSKPAETITELRKPSVHRKRRTSG